MPKNYIHALADNYTMARDYQKLYRLVEDYEYISFDIFDTLIKRDVPKPSDVFEVVGARSGISDFKQKRINAEEEARQNASSSEVSLGDIYEKLAYISNYKSIMDLECQVELDECVPNKDIVDFFNYCVKHKKVILISDMYLPRKVIENILSKNGFSGYESLTISNEEKMVKADGKLFSFVLDNEGIPNNEIIHIGNSMRADYLGARKAHIAAIKISTFKNRSDRKFQYMFSDEEKHDYLSSFINNHLDLKSSYYNFGYQCFGPLLYGFVTWLRNDLKKKNFEQVFFMARDGYIMKKIYDELCDSSDVPSYYFEASRRSLRVPTYNSTMNYSEMLDVLTVPNLTNPKQVLDSWGLDFNQYSEELSKFGFDLNSSIKRDSLSSNVNFQKFFNEIRNDILNNSSDELKSLESYLGEFNFKKKTAIVDIGWGGSMQHFLIETLDNMKIVNNVSGYYIGLTKKSLTNLKENSLNAHGYAFDAMNNGDVDMERPFVGLFETLFLEQAGSVKRYMKEGNHVSVERYPYEYIVDGKKGKEIHCVKSIQDGAVKFSKDFNKTATADYIGFDQKTMFSNLYQIGIRPTLADVRLFGGFEFFNNGTKVYLAKPRTMRYYLLHVNVLKNDLYDSQWKIGFLKQLLKIPLNYENIFRFLRKATN